MSIYNPASSYRREPLTVAPVWCKLEILGSGNDTTITAPTLGRPIPTIQGDQNRISYEFRVNPETIEVDASADIKELAVLGTSQPLAAYRSSKTVISLPSVQFWSQNSNLDLTEDLETLTSWTRPVKETFEPPKLSFKFGAIVHEPLFLSRFRYTIIQTRSGKPTEAEGSMDFVLAPAEPEAQEAPDGTRLSERERADNARRVRDLLRTEVPVGDVVEVTARGVVELVAGDGSRRRIGTIWSLLGNVVRPGRTEQATTGTTTPPPTTATVNQRGV